MKFIEEIFKNSQQVHFEGADQYEKFARIFADLYRIELFKSGLDVVLTNLRNKKLKFEIKIIRDWDTNVGCYLTEQNKVYNKLLGVFSHSISQKIILRQLSYNVLAHEMAHALEFSSALNLNEEFRKCIGFDMKDREPKFITLKAEIKRLMVEQVKSYPQHQIISELFARYFELLSISRNVKGNGDFATKDVMDFFANTTNYIIKIFNAEIKNLADPDIAAYTTTLVEQLSQEKVQQKFADKVDTFYKKTGDKAANKWAGNVKSNAAWQQSWEKFKGIEEKKSDS